jgi:hypothetical protein
VFPLRELLPFQGKVGGTQNALIRDAGAYEHHSLNNKAAVVVRAHLLAYNVRAS